MATLRPTLLLRPVVAAAAAGLALAGCAAQPGTAATVNGVTISENAVDDATGEYVAFSGQETAPVVILNTLVQAELLTPIANEAGYAVSDAEVEQFFLEQAVMLGNAELPENSSDAFIDLGRFLMQYNEVSSSPDAEAVLTQLGTELTEADLEVNPRYGELTEEGSIVPTTHEWIAQPTGEAAQPAG
ncbi:SurA N-terminal domain-containing protein [Georgenia subflava]|uniref:SurA N-terminal domain-containing protein n=1 Tax=Georgenia subflava TaxID=1622177 RepID=A0A6N7EMJ0_9MICO|nr:hypothetical protein [Georgenia subflava]MPV38348.1 hypothetical protein [Georgenia subflava]